MSELFRNFTSRPLLQRVMYVVGVGAVAGLAVVGLVALLRNYRPALAQSVGTFDSGSTGVDGALNLSTPGTIIFDPHTFSPTLDADGDYIYNFTTINVGPGVTVSLKAPYLNAPVYWLASGAVQIDGVIDLNGANGHDQTGDPAERIPSLPGAGGYAGGAASGNDLIRSGSGPGAGRCCGGGLTPNANSDYMNNFLAPLIGGSGGSGAGGAGGGALLIASSVAITVNGTIMANPGDAGIGGNGRGSGGEIHLLAPTIAGNGTLQATASQAAGRIRLDAFQQSYTGSSAPAAILGTPFSVLLPDTPPPSVRVVDVAGASVPLLPSDSFTTPDVTINTSSTVTLTIEAKYVPLGSVVTLAVLSENAPDQLNTSTPLTGTLALSTATVTATVSTGYSRMFVRSDWTP